LVTFGIDGIDAACGALEGTAQIMMAMAATTPAAHAGPAPRGNERDSFRPLGRGSKKRASSTSAASSVSVVVACSPSDGASASTSASASVSSLLRCGSAPRRRRMRAGVVSREGVTSAGGGVGGGVAGRASPVGDESMTNSSSSLSNMVADGQ
jgi:hypothetical protein